MTELARTEDVTVTTVDVAVEVSNARKNKAFAKIYNSRMSREELRASMLEKAKNVVEKGIGSLDLVTVVEHR